MALRQSILLDTGITIADAYRRVENISIISKSLMRASVRSYADVEKPACHDVAVVCAYNLDGANPIAQAYAHLKSLPEFAGATDC